MNEVLFVILHRLRRPLIFLIGAYAVSIWGLTLIPKVEASGEVIYLSFFHALYMAGKTAQVVRYGGESHSLAQSPANIRDVYSRILEWFDTYLNQ